MTARLFLDDIAIIVLFTLNIMLSAYGIYADNRGYSLNKIYWIFNLIFLALVPALQYGLGVFAWGKTFQNQTILWANGLILLCNIAYSITRHQTLKSGSTRSLKAQESTKPIHLKVFLVLLFVFSAAQIFLQGRGLLVRSETNVLDSIGNSSIQLFIDKFLKGVVLFGLLFAVQLWRERKISNLYFTVVILISVLANFPLAVPRYWAATFYLALLLSIFSAVFFKFKNLFSSLVFAIILIAFPVLSIFRYSLLEIKNKFSSFHEVFSFSYLGGDFDAYSSLCSTIEFVQKSSITWGRQLATVLLFFVPRSLWGGKSVGSGALVNQLPNSDFSNFCSPFLAEGYINFGIIGSIFFIIGLAWVITRYDDYFWTANKKSYPFIFYPAAMGMLFFMLRGDLLSSFAYTVGIYISGWAFYKIIERS